MSPNITWLYKEKKKQRCKRPPPPPPGCPGCPGCVPHLLEALVRILQGQNLRSRLGLEAKAKSPRWSVKRSFWRFLSVSFFGVFCAYKVSFFGVFWCFAWWLLLFSVPFWIWILVGGCFFVLCLNSILGAATLLVFSWFLWWLLRASLCLFLKQKICFDGGLAGVARVIQGGFLVLVTKHVHGGLLWRVSSCSHRALPVFSHMHITVWVRDPKILVPTQHLRSLSADNSNPGGWSATPLENPVCPWCAVDKFQALKNITNRSLSSLPESPGLLGPASFLDEKNLKIITKTPYTYIFSEAKCIQIVLKEIFRSSVKPTFRAIPRDGGPRHLWDTLPASHA